MKIVIFPVDKERKQTALYLEGGTPIKIKELLDGNSDCVTIQEIWKAALGDKEEVTYCHVFPTWKHRQDIRSLLVSHFPVKDLSVVEVPTILVGTFAFRVDATAKQIAEKIREGGIEVEFA